VPNRRAIHRLLLAQHVRHQRLGAGRDGFGRDEARRRLARAQLAQLNDGVETGGAADQMCLERRRRLRAQAAVQVCRQFDRAGAGAGAFALSGGRALPPESDFVRVVVRGVCHGVSLFSFYE
jgi:hypothetical protein